MTYHPSFKLKLFNYLETVRQSGEYNMFGMRPHIQAAFDVSKKEAGKLLSLYMAGNLVENVVKR